MRLLDASYSTKGTVPLHCKVQHVITECIVSYSRCILLLYSTLTVDSLSLTRRKMRCRLCIASKHSLLRSVGGAIKP